jgi:glucose-6-phosphate 1-dehydrogenase
VELQIDSWRWCGAPFYIRVGKSLPTTTTEVVVKLKCPPQDVFHEEDLSHSSHVRFRLSPEVVIALGARAKLAGERMVGEDVELSVRHQGPDEMGPYERLIGDAMAGDATLFAREDAVEAAWSRSLIPRRRSTSMSEEAGDRERRTALPRRTAAATSRDDVVTLRAVGLDRVLPPQLYNVVEHPHRQSHTDDRCRERN